MSKDDLESLIKYVADMADRSIEYGYDEREVLNELDSKDTEVSNDLYSLYDQLGAVTICRECGSKRLYDKKNDEYYCPIHDK